jgi:peroxiredoxin
MKKILVFTAVLPVMVFAQQKTSAFKIKGNINNVNAGIEWVYFSYMAEGEWKTDSIKPKNGKYRFNGQLAEPQAGRLRVKYFAGADGKIPATNNKKDIAAIFLEKGKMNVSSLDSFSNIKVNGSESHTEFIKLNNALKPFNEKMEALYASYSEHRKNKDSLRIKQTMDEIDLVTKERNETIYAGYVRNHPNSPLALYAVRQYAGWDIDPDKAEPLFNILPLATQNWPSGIELKDLIEIAKNTRIGRVAMDFTQNDTLGKPITLSSFRGKYLLIDFWASWCGPCRVENPNVVKAFHKYKDKGFDILGVSLDRSWEKEKWLKAIHDDQLAWTQVSDLKFWENEVAKQFGIRAIPQNFLLDPEGKIIAKNLRGEDLDKKLEEFIIEGKKAF